MKTITLKEAYDLIESASAVIIDNVVTYPSLYDLTGEADNEWLYLKWEDDYTLQNFVTIFIEEDQEIKFDGTNIFMKDAEDDEQMITLLVPMK